MIAGVVVVDAIAIAVVVVVLAPSAEVAVGSAVESVAVIAGRAAAKDAALAWSTLDDPNVAVVADGRSVVVADGQSVNRSASRSAPPREDRAVKSLPRRCAAMKAGWVRGLVAAVAGAAGGTAMTRVAREPRALRTEANPRKLVERPVTNRTPSMAPPW